MTALARRLNVAAEPCVVRQAEPECRLEASGGWSCAVLHAVSAQRAVPETATRWLEAGVRFSKSDSIGAVRAPKAEDAHATCKR